MAMHDDDVDAAQFWDSRYSDSERVWSGRPNQTLVDLVSGVPAGRALDLGCGEGGDVVWLAQRGWLVTGVDISPTAIARGSAAATRLGIPEDQIQWHAHDLATWKSDGEYDLVTASFLHSPVEFPRTDVLRRAAEVVAAGGYLIILSHAGMPPWSKYRDHEHRFLTPAEEIAELDLPKDGWETRIAETRSREATGPEGQHAILDDVVVLLQRR
jgi:SAM-dependent methyltransferase